MGPLVRATLATLLAFNAASFTVRPAVADDGDAYYPASVGGRNGPEWERPKFTQFKVTRCSAGALAIDKLALNRNDVSQSKGPATYTDAAKATSVQAGAGDWSLAGSQLKVSGDGFVLVGRWTGALLTATITRPGAEPARCRFQVTALRSFTEYQ
jgi:hypothetical protein